MPPSVSLRDFIPSAADGPFAALLSSAPWEVTSKAETIVRNALGALAGYSLQDGVALHRTAIVESGTIIKPPAIIGPKCFVAATAYLRGGVFLDEGCVVGPACELKSVFMLPSAKIAHLSFVGDSIIGAGVNVEAGAVIANYRNELGDRILRLVYQGEIIETGVEKFGALVGDGAKIGANAVIAPGALIPPHAIIERLALVDQSPPS